MGKGSKPQTGKKASASASLTSFEDHIQEESWNRNEQFRSDFASSSELAKGFVDFIEEKYAERLKGLKSEPYRLSDVLQAHLEAYMKSPGLDKTLLFTDAKWREGAWREEALREKTQKGTEGFSFEETLLKMLENNKRVASFWDSLSPETKEELRKLGRDSYPSQSALAAISYLYDREDCQKRTALLLGLEEGLREDAFEFVKELLRGDPPGEGKEKETLALLIIQGDIVDIAKMAHLLRKTREECPELEKPLFRGVFLATFKSGLPHWEILNDDAFLFLKSQRENIVRLDWKKVSKIRQKNPGIKHKEIERILMLDEF